MKRERGTGSLCRNGPKGASHKANLSPFRSGYSLASVLLMVTVAAVVMAAAATAMKGEHRSAVGMAGLFTPIGAVVGVAIGTAVAYGRTRKIRWAFVGALIGLVAGIIAALVSAFPRGAPALVLGSVIVVLYAVVVRVFSRHDPR